MTAENPPAPDGAPEPSTPALSTSRHDAAEGVTWGVRVAGAWAWRFIVVVVAGYLVVRGVSAVSTVAFSLVLALFITAILHPLERRLRRYIPRGRSLPATISLLIGIAVLGAVFYFVSIQIADHATTFGNQLSRVVTNVEDFLVNGPLHVKQSDVNNISTSITNTIKSHTSQIVSGAIDTVRTVADVLEALLLIIISTFFFLRDGELIWGWAVRLFPSAAQPRVDRAGRAGWFTFGGYMRGQLTIALFHAVTITILLVVLNVPLALALGVIIFIGSFIPILGLLVAGILAVGITLLEHGLTDAIIVAVGIIILAQVESNILQPVIMSRAVEIHPLAVAVSVLSGSALAGVPGALIAVPLVAFLNTTVRSMRAPWTEDTTQPVSGKRHILGRLASLGRRPRRPKNPPPDSPDPS